LLHFSQNSLLIFLPLFAGPLILTYCTTLSGFTCFREWADLVIHLRLEAQLLRQFSSS
jgi:hypothetical protein